MTLLSIGEAVSVEPSLEICAPEPAPYSCTAPIRGPGARPGHILPLDHWSPIRETRLSLPRPCRRCGKPGKAICELCRSADNRRREAARPSARQRGYDSTYSRNRALMIARAWANGELCAICGREFARKEDITAEHLIPLRRDGTSALGNLGPAHGKCNSWWSRSHS